MQYYDDIYGDSNNHSLMRVHLPVLVVWHHLVLAVYIDHNIIVITCMYVYVRHGGLKLEVCQNKLMFASLERKMHK